MEPSPLTHVRRLGSYAFWHSAGLMLPLALDRLVICPVLNHHLGEEAFGGFIWVIGIMNLFGNIGANGFAILLMRHMAMESADGARTMMRTSLLLSSGLSFLIVIVASLGSLCIADDIVRANAPALYVPLVVYALLRSVQLLVITNLRIKRRFAGLFLVKLCEGIALLGILVFAPGQDFRVIGAIYAMSIVLSLPIGVATSRDVIGTGTWWDSKAARCLVAGWYAGAMLTVADQAQLYAARLIVGAASGSAEVAVLYAGTSVAHLFVFPAGLLGSLVLSLLASKTTFVLAGRRGRLYWLFVGGLAAGIGVVSYVFGAVLIRMLYPELAARTLDFYHWLAVANGCTCIHVLMRPVAVKYANMARVVGVSVITVAVQLGALGIMVPLAHARGAAIALAASSALGALLWLMYFDRLRRRAGHEAAGPNGLEN